MRKNIPYSPSPSTLAACIVSTGNACVFCLKKNTKNGVPIAGSIIALNEFSNHKFENIRNIGMIFAANGTIIEAISAINKIFLLLSE